MIDDSITRSPQRGDNLSSMTGSEFLRAYERDPLETLSTLVTGQDYSRLQVGQRDVLLINSPSLLHLVMTDKRFIRGKVTRTLKRLFGHGLGTLDGQEHREHRSVLQPAFSARIIESLYAPTISSETARFAERFEDEQVIDIFAEVARFLVDLTTKNLFDSDWRNYDVDIASCLRTGSRFVVGRATTPGPGFFQQGRSYFHTTMETALNCVLEQYDDTGADPERVLSIIMREGMQHHNWSHDAVRDELRFLLVAGVETTAATLCFALYLLARYEQAQENVIGELNNLKSREELYTQTDLREMSQLVQVIKETLRLYPPVWIFTREAEVDVDREYLSIEKGTTVFLSAYVTQRDPRYFVSAEKFCPRRFNEKPTSWTYFPFGGGSRHCIGEGYGMTVLGLLIANMVRCWQLLPVAETSLELEPASTLVPAKPCLIKLKRR